MCITITSFLWGSSTSRMIPFHFFLLFYLSFFALYFESICLFIDQFVNSSIYIFDCFINLCITVFLIFLSSKYVSSEASWYSIFFSHSSVQKIKALNADTETVNSTSVKDTEISSPYGVPGLKFILQESCLVSLLVSSYFAMVLTNWATIQVTIFIYLLYLGSSHSRSHSHSTASVPCHQNKYRAHT